MPFVLERKEKGVSGSLLRGAACRNHRPIAFGREICRYAKGIKEGKKIALPKESLVRVLDFVEWNGVYCKERWIIYAGDIAISQSCLIAQAGFDPMLMHRTTYPNCPNGMRFNFLQAGKKDCCGIRTKQ